MLFFYLITILNDAIILIGDKMKIDNIIGIAQHEKRINNDSSYNDDFFNQKNVTKAFSNYDEYISKSIDDFLTGKSEMLFDMNYFKNIYNKFEEYGTISLYAGIEVKKMRDSVVVMINRISNRSFTNEGEELYYPSSYETHVLSSGTIYGSKMSPDFKMYYPVDEKRFDYLENYLSETMMYCCENEKSSKL